MFKLGGMCHCSADFATLWKIDLSDGSVVWTADRLATAGLVSVVEVGSDLFVYEGGGFNAACESLTKWQDNGSSASRLWNFAKVSQSQHGVAGLAVTDDDVSWVSHTNSTDITRIDASGAEINSSTSAFTLPEVARVTKSGNGVVYWQTGASASTFSVRQYDSTFATTASILPGSSREWAINSSPTPYSFSTTRAATRWGNVDDPFGSGFSGSVQLVHYDANLAEINRSGTLSFATVGLAEVMGENHMSTTTGRVYDLTTMTFLYSFTGRATSYVFDPSGNMYSLNSGTVSAISKHDTSNTLVWTTAITTAGATPQLMYHDGRVFVTSCTNNHVSGTPEGVGTIDVAGNTNYAIASFDATSGAFQWGNADARVGTTNGGKFTIYGDYLYATGQRVTV